MTTETKRFIPRYLDPASRVGEILFGLIMVLTVTLTAGLTVAEGPEGVHQLLIAAIGCNIAWGIIDAVMYVMDCVIVRSGKARLIQAVQTAPNPETALALIQNEVDPELQELLEPEDSAQLRQTILKHIEKVRVIKSHGLTHVDFYGAFACFFLVFVSCLPAAIPFLIFSQPHFALRVSNFLLIGLLFLVGRKWAKHAGTNGLIAGSVMVVLGLILVGLAILLGG
jgi:hypothetical protein